VPADVTVDRPALLELALDEEPEDEDEEPADEDPAPCEPEPWEPDPDAPWRWEPPPPWLPNGSWYWLSPAPCASALPGTARARAAARTAQRLAGLVGFARMGATL
jgi:hypothetical protein